MVLVFVFHVAPDYIVSFNHSTMSVNENDRQVVPVLVLNRLPINNVTVVVLTTDGSATGKNAQNLMLL